MRIIAKSYTQYKVLDESKTHKMIWLHLLLNKFMQAHWLCLWLDFNFDFPYANKDFTWILQ